MLLFDWLDKNVSADETWKMIGIILDPVASRPSYLQQFNSSIPQEKSRPARLTSCLQRTNTHSTVASEIAAQLSSGYWSTLGWRRLWLTGGISLDIRLSGQVSILTWEVGLCRQRAPPFFNFFFSFFFWVLLLGDRRCWRLSAGMLLSIMETSQLILGP